MTRANRFYSKRQERKTAAIIGGKPQPNSGATPTQKGDVKGERLLVDSKTVTKPQASVTIRKEWFAKLEREAFGVGAEISAVNIDFGDNGEQYFILNSRDFRRLYEAWLSLEEGDHGQENGG